MKKKLFKYVGLVIFAILVIVAICNIYTWIVSGKQYIRISTASKAYANSDFYISFVAQEKQVDLETKTNIKLLDSNGKKVKDVNIKYENNSAVISIPDVEAGTYTIEADVSSKLGKDKIKKEIYVSKENNENIVISIDKGIYKPGDTISFRALVTDKENDEPISKDVNVSIFDGNDNRDIILVYMGNGTISPNKMLKEIKDAFIGSEYEVYIASLGLEKQDYDNVHVDKRWDFSKLLDGAALFINHGGQNSIIDGLIYGVPQLICPGRVFERIYNGKSVENVNVGMVLGLDEFKSEIIRSRSERIIGDISFRENSKLIGDKLKSQRGIDSILDFMDGNS